MSTCTPPAGHCLSDNAYLADLRQQMMKFAMLQLRDDAAAEDAVQDALIGAMKNADKFAGKAAFKSWVFAILKHKINDAIRGKSRTVAISDLQADPDGPEDTSFLFDEVEHWKAEHAPSKWRDPEQQMQNGQFWLVFETCLNKLPAAQARCFMMREFIGLDSAEICKELALSTTNLHVQLHRARLSLQKCLDTNWFKEKTHA
jgi:RNA polymerase sigma-70 factor, ECF subfamily